ncbi:unnamed protein product [Hydatigera taeniaeformis]|uniref:BRCT domain-containing protein n=1 Tax=Hydatigena taeniaeformis TaxID=6205 RepID=A0A0R3WLI3_HYDTA|nr:unnamed protein product [Hydatigera taeniaeformis]
MDANELSSPELGSARGTISCHSSEIDFNRTNNGGSDMNPILNNKSEVKNRNAEKEKRIRDKAGNWMGDGDTLNFEVPKRDDGVSDFTNSKEKGKCGGLQSDMSELYDELEDSTFCEDDPFPMTKRNPLYQTKGNGSAVCEEREEAECTKEIRKTRPVTPRYIEQDEEIGTDTFYDLYEEVGIEEEKVVTNTSSITQTDSRLETILRLLRRSAKWLPSIRRMNNRILIWKASASGKTRRNKGSAVKTAKNMKTYTPEIIHNAIQHREDITKVVSQNEVSYESEWNADAEYEYDEMTECEQQSTEGYLNGMDPNGNADLYDDIVPKDNSRAIHSAVDEPLSKTTNSKNKCIEKKCNSVRRLKSAESPKPLNTETDYRKQSSEAACDGKLSDENDGDEIYTNAELFKGLSNKLKTADSPPPVPPKMFQTTQPHGSKRGTDDKAQVAQISKKCHNDIFNAFGRRQLSLTRTILPTKKHNVRSKRNLGMLKFWPVRPKHEKKPVNSEEVNKIQTSAEGHVERLPDGKTTTSFPYEGEGEYEEYCYPAELVEPQQRDKAKLPYIKPHSSMNEPRTLEKSSDMLSNMEVCMTEDFYEDSGTSPERLSMHCQGKLMDRCENGFNLQPKSEKMAQTPKMKRYEDVQKISDRRLPAPPIPVGDGAVKATTKVATPTSSLVIVGNQSCLQIKEERGKEQVSEGQPRTTPQTGKTTSLNSQVAKSETPPPRGDIVGLLTLQSNVRAKADNEAGYLKSTPQPKIVPTIPPRPHYIPQSLLLKLAISNAVEVHKRSSTPKEIEQLITQTQEQTNGVSIETGKPNAKSPTTVRNQDPISSEEINSTKVEARKRLPTPKENEQLSNRRQEQTNSDPMEIKKLNANPSTTMENQDSVCDNGTALALECENDLYMQLEDCCT